MDDLLMRLMVASVIAAVAVVAAVVSRRGLAWRRRPFDPGELEPGLHLFSSEGCSSCGRARTAIRAAGFSFAEHTYESEAPLLARYGVDRVPTVAWVPLRGHGGWIAEGTPTTRALLRWVGP